MEPIEAVATEAVAIEAVAIESVDGAIDAKLRD